jgi:hypothetical protein
MIGMIDLTFAVAWTIFVGLLSSCVGVWVLLVATRMFTFAGQHQHLDDSSWVQTGSP